MEKNKYMDGRMGHGGRVCGIRGADSVCGDQLCEQCQHHAGCDTDGGGILPDLDVGYNSDNCEVSIPNNDKYDIVSAKWSSNKERREDRRNLHHESYFKDFK